MTNETRGHRNIVDRAVLGTWMALNRVVDQAEKLEVELEKAKETITAVDRDRAAWRDLAVARGAVIPKLLTYGTAHWRREAKWKRRAKKARKQAAALSLDLQKARHAVSVALGQGPGDVMPELENGISMLKSDRDKFKALYQARHEQAETEKARAETAERELAETNHWLNSHDDCVTKLENRLRVAEAVAATKRLMLTYCCPEPYPASSMGIAYSA